MCIFTTSSGTKVLAIKIQGDLDFGPLHVEAYHLAELLGYSQQHSIRKQVLSNWKDIFEEDVDYSLVHDEARVRGYERKYEKALGVIKPMKLDRGRMFLSPSGLRKVFEHSSKDSRHLKEALAEVIQVQAPPAPDARASSSSEGAGSDAPLLEALERQRQYEILEQLLDHLKNIEEPGLRRLALMSAELGLGRKLGDIRALLDLEQKPTTMRDPGQQPTVTGASPLPPPPAFDQDQATREYLANRPITQGPVFDNIAGVHYGLKQIGEKAGGYTAVQAGKAADVVAGRMGYSHDDIRRKKLPFNELPELPDTTSGKLRKMYRFNSSFANHVIVELRTNKEFVPGKPMDLGPFGKGGDNLPKLSRGPFDE
jgi:hypothetical protein